MLANDLSAYAENLSEEARTRYKEKLKVINGFDPFTGTTGELADCSPPVEAADIVSYLVLQTSFMTAKQFKARRSLEAYNQFVSGWVKEVCSQKVAGKFVITGQISYILLFAGSFCILVAVTDSYKYGCVYKI